MQTYPFHALDVSHIADKVGDMALAVDVHSIVGELLLYHLKLLNTLTDQLPHLVENLLLGARVVSPRDERDGTVGAMTVAALGYLDVGIMVGRGEMTAPIAGRHVGLAQISEQLLVVELAVELVHLRDSLLEFILITLRETAHDKELAQLSLRFARGQLQNHVDAFLLGTLNKATRIHHSYLALRLGTVVDAVIAIGLELLHEQLRVDEIL